MERVVYIDTWLDNPKMPEDSKKCPSDCDLFLVTHGHFDHAASAPEFIKTSTKGAKVISNFEIGLHYQKFCDLTEE